MWSDDIDRLREAWTDRYVKAADRPELNRFAGRVGRVITVNCGGKALVDFADGAWYDIPASDDWLITAEDGSGYDAKANSAQANPPRQG